ncbi:MAG TPA: hypothetical protein VFE56_06860, partial [Candidatus Binataceae bacterium]|nr:hypothetical protein [Candidatus Binataceae bacterium]
IFCSRNNQDCGSDQVQEPWIKCPRQLLGSGGASEQMLARHRQAGTPVPLFKKIAPARPNQVQFAHKRAV